MLPQNIAHVHVMLNTIPYIGLAFGIVMAILGWRRRKPDIVRTGLLTFIIIAAITVPVYLTGLGAHHVVTGLPDVSPDLIKAHERSAIFTLLTVLALGIVSLGGYYFHRRVRLINPSYLIFVVFLAIVAEVLVLRTSLLGGRINHPEVRRSYRAVPEQMLPDSTQEQDSLLNTQP
jgi:hypothetical protein